MSGGGASAGTNGFLFCDLRGYTAYVEAHGDQAAAELLATYRALVRTAIASHAGAEIKTEGDSVYVVFPAASAAVEAGLEIVAAATTASTKTAPIRVGVGIHAGETVATTEGLVGGAVNIAARVCAKARAGEVLVTDTVRALTRTYLPYRYTSLGTQTLKGIAGGIPLYRVEAVPSSARARLSRQLGARRGRVLVLASLVVVALVAVTGLYALNRPTDCLSLPASTKDVVAKIDPIRNCVVAVYPVGRRPGPIVVSDGRVWVASAEDQTISIVDLKTGPTRTTGAGGVPIGLTAGPGAVYVLTQENGASRIPIALERIQATYLLPRPLNAVGPITTSGYSGIAFASDRVWITNALTGDVLRLKIPGGGSPLHVADPAAVTVDSGVATTSIGPIAASGGAIWLADSGSPLMYRIDALGAKPASVTTDPAHAGTREIAASSKAVWLLHDDGYLTRIDAATGARASTAVLNAGTALAATDDSVWATDLVGAKVASIDPETGEVVATTKVGGRPAGVAIAPDRSVWVTIQGP